MKKMLCLLTAICCILPLYARTEFTANGITYVNDPAEGEVSGTVFVSQVQPTDSIIIPPCVGYNGDLYVVSSIGPDAFKAFKACNNPTTVSLPNTLTSLDFDAFKGFTGLQTLKIPNSVKELKIGLYGCKNLTSLLLPDSIKLVNIDAASGLTSLDIPNSVTSLHLYKLHQLSTINFSNSSIEDFSIIDCPEITSLDIPNTVKELFLYKCPQITSLEIPDSVTNLTIKWLNLLSTIKFPNSDLDYCEIFACDELTTLEIPGSAIGTLAVHGSDKLSSIKIPDTVKSLLLIRGCPEITTLEMPDSINELDLQGLTSLKTIRIGKNLNETVKDYILNYINEEDAENGIKIQLQII